MSIERKHHTIDIGTNTIIRVIGLGLLVALLFVISDLVLVILTSIVIASFIGSVVKKLEVYKIPRTVSVVVVYVISLGVIIALFYLFVPVFLDEVSALVVSLGSYVPQNSVLQNFQNGTITETSQIISDVSQNTSLGELITSVRTLVNNVSGGFVQTVGVLFGGIFNVMMIAVITFYLSIQERGIEYMLRIVMPQKYEVYAIDLWRRTERKIGLWLQGQLLLGLLIGVMTYLGLAILGVKYALVLAIVAGLMEIIPFGIILAGLVAVGSAFLDGGVALSFKVFLLFTILQQFENYLIAPMIVKKVVGISPLVVILSVLIGAQLAGFWGVILGVPVAVSILEYFDDVGKDKVARVA